MITNLNEFINEKSYSGKDHTGISHNITPTGVYNVVSNKINTTINLVGWEKYDNDSYSFYQYDSSKNEEINVIIVKKSAINKMSNGKTIIAKTSNGDIVKINKIKNLNENKFTNIGHDEEGYTLGNCTVCNSKGIIIDKHLCGETIFYKILQSTDEDIKVKLLSLCGISSDQYAQTEEYPTDIELNSALKYFKDLLIHTLNENKDILNEICSFMIKEDVDNNVILPSSNDNLDNENNNNLNDLLYVGRFIL